MKNNLVFLVGLPASGKSTISKEYKDKGYVVLSSDIMREKLYGDVNNQDSNSELFSRMYRIAREMLHRNKNVLIDATNISSKRRINAISKILTNTSKDNITIDKNNVSVIAEIIACPYNECIDRNKLRDRKVPNGAIENMYKSWQTPMKQEGFDEIKLTYTSNYMEETLKVIERLKKYPQFNKNHTLTIGEHCLKVGNLLRLDNNINLMRAGYLHDIGKLFCMGFKDSYGRKIEEAHFYSHESVSAYDSLFFDRELYSNVKNLDRIEISQLITWHMLMHRLESEKSIEKYRNFLGEKFWNDLAKLHEADKNGR